MSDTIGPGPGTVDTRVDIGGRSRVVPKTPVYSFGGAGVARKPPTQSWQLSPAANLYEQQVALGQQTLSRCRTAPRYEVGRSTRDQQAKVYQGRPTLDSVVSPGPAAYDRVARLGTLLGESAPSYSFGEGDEVEGNAAKGSRVPLTSAIRPPGPGQYDHDTAIGKQAQSARPTAPLARFPQARRGAYKKQHTGMPTIAVVDPKEPAFTYAHQRPTVGVRSWEQSTVRQQPAFSFGARSKTVPRKARSKKETHAAYTKTRPATSHARSRGSAPSKRASDNYDWLYPARQQQAGINNKAAAAYEKRLDGCEMGRAKAFNTPPKIGFKTEPRFNAASGGAGRPSSPGPVYLLPPAMGEAHATYSAPAYSFPTHTSRENPETVMRAKEAMPGPGQYNTLQEHRVDAEMAAKLVRQHAAERTAAMAATGDSEDSEDGDSEVGGFGVDSLHPSRQADKFERTSLHMRFGAMTHLRTSPIHGFGSASRKGRAKMFGGTPELNRDLEGKDSPGPTSAVRNEQFGKTGVLPGTPVYSFGGAGVPRNKLEPSLGIGPASVPAVSQFGKMADSRLPSSGTLPMSQTTRARQAVLYQVRRELFLSPLPSRLLLLATKRKTLTQSLNRISLFRLGIGRFDDEAAKLHAGPGV